MPYSHPRLTVRPTAHDATNVVIEEAEQELSVRLPYWRLNRILIAPLISFFYCYHCPLDVLAGVGVVPRRSCLIQRREYSTPPSNVRDKFECWRVVLLHDAHAVCVVRPHTFRGTLTSVYVSLAHTASKTKAHESSAVVNSCREWARDRLMLIGTKLGNRTKNSVLCMYP